MHQRHRDQPSGAAMIPRPLRETAAQTSAQLATALGALTAVTLLAHHLDFDTPPAFDRRIRRIAQSRSMNGARVALAPLFPVGLPGGYLTIACSTAHWLGRRRRTGGPAIVTSAWLGWLVHRAVKLGYRRERPPRPMVRRRTDSFPSGHTTGATALAITMALVLHRGGVIPRARATALAAGAPLVMGMYRVIADDHWATDVIGGWLLGGAIALTCTAVLGPRQVASRSSPAGATSASRRRRSVTQSATEATM
jgi:membrane-associated phospholipid phosphatase